MKSSKIKEVEVITLSHEQLMKGMYWAWDAFDRCLMNFFLVYKTAEDVLQKKQLSGDRVTIGVRKNDWISGSKGIFDSFAGYPEEKTDAYEKFMVDGVPVYIYIFGDDACVRNPQTMLYERENFNLPNPYSQFLEVYGSLNN